MNWTPQKHTIVKNESLRNTIHETGYSIEGNIGSENISKLTLLYQELHHFNAPEGGNFYSLYSSDIIYRKKVHDTIGKILNPIYDIFFSDYKSVINSFIVKMPGPQSEFTLHQDSSGLDEFRYSPLSIWIPLQDTSLQNGTLCVIPKSHRFFYPYRGISFDPPFKEYEELLRHYLLPLNLAAGDILMFDNRLVHYSHINESPMARVVVMSGLFPIAANIQVCYKDETISNSPLELYEQNDDFLTTGTAFYHNCTDRPRAGKKIGEITEIMPPISADDFIRFALADNVMPTNISELINIRHSIKILAEPV